MPMEQCPNTELVQGWEGAWSRCRRRAGHEGSCRFLGTVEPDPAERHPAAAGAVSRPVLYDQGTPALSRRHALALAGGIALVLVPTLLVVAHRAGLL